MIKKTPYYGWWIVGAAVLSQFAFMTAGQATVGVFLRPVTDDLGWQVWQFTLGSSLAVGAGAISGIFAGNVVDKRGPRPLLITGAAVSAICFYLLSIQSTYWIFLSLYVLSGLLGWTLYGPLVINATLNKWFIRRRGWALAIGSAGISLGGLIAPVSMTAIVDGFGWRTGYAALAAFCIIIVVPIAFIMRRTPEDLGLLPDGDAGPDDSVDEQAQVDRHRQAETPSLTRHQAVRTSSFWLLVVGFGVIQMSLMSVLIHAIPFATDVGFTRSLAALGLAVNGLGNLSSKVVWGYGLQRVPAKRLVLVANAASCTGVATMLVAAQAGSLPLLLLGFFFYGFGFGGTIPLSEFIWARYFGRANIGAIRGISYPATVIGAAAGPVLVGLWFDFAQNYQPAFLAIIVSYITGATLVAISREPFLKSRTAVN